MALTSPAHQDCGPGLQRCRLGAAYAVMQRVIRLMQTNLLKICLPALYL